MKPILTDRQLQCLALIGEGKDYAEIALELGLSIGTVAGHCAKARVTLNAPNDTSAVVRAVGFGFLWPDFGEDRSALIRAEPYRVTDWMVIDDLQPLGLPRWLLDAITGVQQAAGRHHLGIVGLRGANRHDSLVVMSLADFESQFGGLEAVGNIPQNRNGSCRKLKETVAY